MEKETKMPESIWLWRAYGMAPPWSEDVKIVIAERVFVNHAELKGWSAAHSKRYKATVDGYTSDYEKYGVLLK